MSTQVLTVAEVEKKYERPMWAKMLGRIFYSDHRNDHTPYYWIDETQRKIKRVTSISRLRDDGDFPEMIAVVAYYTPVSFNRPFFEELKQATRLEF